MSQVSQSGLDLESLNPEPHLKTDSSSSQPESSAKQQENTAVQTSKLVSALLQKTVVEAEAGLGRASDQENVSGLQVSQPLTLQSGTGAWTHDKPPEGMNATEALTVRIPNVLDWTPASFTLESVNARRARAKLSHQEKTDNLELVRTDGSASPEWYSAALRPAGARAAGATFLQVSHVAMTDLCHAEERTMSSALNPVEGGEARAESSTGEPVCLASARAAAAGVGSSASTEEINPIVPSESESCQSEQEGEQEPISGEEGPLEVSTVEDAPVNVNSPDTGSVYQVFWKWWSVMLGLH